MTRRATAGALAAVAALLPWVAGCGVKAPPRPPLREPPPAQQAPTGQAPAGPIAPAQQPATGPTPAEPRATSPAGTRDAIATPPAGTPAAAPASDTNR